MKKRINNKKRRMRSTENFQVVVIWLFISQLPEK